MHWRLQSLRVDDNNSNNLLAPVLCQLTRRMRCSAFGAVVFWRYHKSSAFGGSCRCSRIRWCQQLWKKYRPLDCYLPICPDFCYPSRIQNMNVALWWVGDHLPALTSHEFRFLSLTWMSVFSFWYLAWLISNHAFKHKALWTRSWW